MFKVSPFGEIYSEKCYKLSYSSKKEAKKKLKQGNAGVKMKSCYQCNVCGKWHLSHLTKLAYEKKVIDYKLMSFLKNDINA